MGTKRRTANERRLDAIYKYAHDNPKGYEEIARWFLANTPFKNIKSVCDELNIPYKHKF